MASSLCSPGDHPSPRHYQSHEHLLSAQSAFQYSTATGPAGVSARPDSLLHARAYPVRVPSFAATEGCRSIARCPAVAGVAREEDGLGDRECKSPEEKEEVLDCVIVGGGIAGLAAAADLEKAGLNFVLLEAGTRLGGRIFTLEGSNTGKGDRPLELGAQWLHGTVGNPLFNFCVDEGIFDSDEGGAELAIAKTPYTSGGFQARRADGLLVPPEEFLKHSEAWSKAVLEAETLYAASLLDEGTRDASTEVQKSLETRAISPTILTSASTVSDQEYSGRAKSIPWRNGSLDETNGIATINGDARSSRSLGKDSVGTFLHRRVREILREAGTDPDEATLGYLRRKQCAVEGCDDLDGVSLAGYGMYEELEGGDVRVPGGFSRVIDALANKLSAGTTRLNSAVSMVQWAELEGNKHSGNSFSDSRASCRQGGISSKGVDADGKGTTEARAARTTATADEYSQERYPCVVEYASCGTKAKGGEEEDVSTRRIRCRRVLVTVGLGVLKDGSALSFCPPLPPAKLSAIDRLGFGTADKVFVRCTRDEVKRKNIGPDPSLHVGLLQPMMGCDSGYDEPDGGTAKEDILEGEQSKHDRGQDQGQPKKRWPQEIFSFATEGDHVYSWLTGPWAREVEIAPAAEVTDTLLSLLRGVTQDSSWKKGGTESRGVPVNGQVQRGTPASPLSRQSSSNSYNKNTRGRPLLVRSDWSSNPLFRGSYSYIATGSSPADMDELARPLSVPFEIEKSGQVETAEENGGAPSSSTRVLFAGEAMHPEFFSTAHGGFETGRHAAREVLVSCTQEMELHS